MKERSRKTPAFHVFYTFVYLPLSIVVALFIALGRTYMIRSAEFSSVVLWVDFVHLLYPWVAAVTSMAALPLLAGRYPSGRRMVLFSETLKTLLAITILWRYFYFGHILQGFVYSILAVLMALVYAYYRRLWWYFLPTA
ncbi:MAG: hypothetical protein ACI4S4_02150, partial [Candidatus Ornithospirochaeta sp.]